MVVTVTSFKRTQASTPSGSQDYCIQCPWPHSRPLSTHTSMETPGHSQANLAQSLVASLLLSSGSWWAQGFVCALEYTSRKSRDTWSNRKIWPWSRKQNRSKANRVLLRESTGRRKYSLPITQEKTLHMDITRWSIPKSDWLYSLQLKMEKLYGEVSKNKTGSWLWLSSWTPYCQIQT